MSGRYSYFNELPPADLERLALLSEELGEAQQAIGKLLRHGYSNFHPITGIRNRDALERELGDVIAAIRILDDAENVQWDRILPWSDKKMRRVSEYLHHAKVKTPKTKTPKTKTPKAKTP